MAASRETLNVFHLALPVLNTSQVVMLQRSLCPYMVMIMYFQWTLWTVQQDSADIYLYFPTKVFRIMRFVRSLYLSKGKKSLKKQERWLTRLSFEKQEIWDCDLERGFLEMDIICWKSKQQHCKLYLKVKTAALQNSTGILIIVEH